MMTVLLVTAVFDKTEEMFGSKHQIEIYLQTHVRDRRSKDIIAVAV